MALRLGRVSAVWGGRLREGGSAALSCGGAGHSGGGPCSAPPCVTVPSSFVWSLCIDRRLWACAGHCVCQVRTPRPPSKDLSPLPSPVPVPHLLGSRPRGSHQQVWGSLLPDLPGRYWLDPGGPASVSPGCLSSLRPCSWAPAPPVQREPRAGHLWGPALLHPSAPATTAVALGTGPGEHSGCDTTDRYPQARWDLDSLAGVRRRAASQRGGHTRRSEAAARTSQQADQEPPRPSPAWPWL